jgi:hypothetical protein
MAGVRACLRTAEDIFGGIPSSETAATRIRAI